MSAPEVASTTESEDSYEIDVDESSYDEPAVIPVTDLVRAKQPKPVKPVKVPKPPKTPRPAKVRTDNANRGFFIAAGIVGAIGLLFSVILATGALLIALDVDQGTAFFAHLSDVCDGLVGPLKDVFNFSGVNADKKEALVGWGLGSMGYLLVGRFVQSILMSRVKD
ncbi:MAG: hypothetical protein H7288_02220 [Kineosporiaceae bacterium]|nr:hypothetical protein [Aeromicrobium sp.]